MTNVLITGINGMAASHLADYILQNHRGYQVVGTLRHRSDQFNVQHLKHLDSFSTVSMDLTDAQNVHNVLQQVQPERIFHLAAQSFVRASWQYPTATAATNEIGTINLLEAARKLKLPPIIQVAGSSEEYGLVTPEECPITEDQPFRPLSPYGVSKIAQEYYALQYYHSYRLPVVVTRAFNHTGPRRHESFAESSFAKQLVEIAGGLAKSSTLKVGDLTPVRDWTDVRDTVRAYWLLTDQISRTAGEVFNISTRQTTTIQQVLDFLIEYSGLTVEVVKDPSRMRPSDVMLLEGDNSKLLSVIDWQPEYSLDRTLAHLYDWWNDRLNPWKGHND